MLYEIFLECHIIDTYYVIAWSLISLLIETCFAELAHSRAKPMTGLYQVFCQAQPMYKEEHKYIFSR